VSGRVQLTRPLVLEAATRVPDGAGGFSESWAPLGVLWAELRAGSGRDRDEGPFTIASVPYRIIVRGAPEGAPSRPKPEQRLVDGARIFRILAVAEHDPAGRYLVCHAREEVSA
jgi:head-tail adaptor